MSTQRSLEERDIGSDQNQEIKGRVTRLAGSGKSEDDSSLCDSDREQQSNADKSNAHRAPALLIPSNAVDKRCDDRNGDNQESEQLNRGIGMLPKVDRYIHNISDEKEIKFHCFHWVSQRGAWIAAGRVIEMVEVDDDRRHARGDPSDGKLPSASSVINENQTGRPNQQALKRRE